MTYNFSLMN